MDMSLPVIDGWEATRRLKADATSRIRSSLLLPTRWDDRESHLAGCGDYDTKPVDLSIAGQNRACFTPGRERPRVIDAPYRKRR